MVNSQFGYIYPLLLLMYGYYQPYTGIISLILSIIALMKSNDVNKYNMMGESSALLAQDASKTAKTLNIISSILLAVGFITSIVYIFVYGLADIAKAMQ